MEKKNNDFGYTVPEIIFADSDGEKSSQDSSSESHGSVEFESSEDENVQVQEIKTPVVRKKRKRANRQRVKLEPKPSINRSKPMLPPPRKKVKKNSQNPFPLSVYNLIKQTRPSLDLCTRVSKPTGKVERNQKRAKPEWYVKKTQLPSIVRLEYKDKRWRDGRLFIEKLQSRMPLRTALFKYPVVGRNGLCKLSMVTILTYA